MINVLELIVRIQFALQDRHAQRREDGFTTAELLGNAALGVVALVMIWGAMNKLGLHVVDYISKQITNGN